MFEKPAIAYHKITERFIEFLDRTIEPLDDDNNSRLVGLVVALFVLVCVILLLTVSFPWMIYMKCNKAYFRNHPDLIRNEFGHNITDEEAATLYNNILDPFYAKDKPKVNWKRDGF